MINFLNPAATVADLVGRICSRQTSNGVSEAPWKSIAATANEQLAVLYRYHDKFPVTQQQLANMG